MTVDLQLLLTIAGYLIGGGIWFRTRKYRGVNQQLTVERIKLLDGIRESLETKVADNNDKISALEKQNGEQAQAIKTITENITQSAKVEAVLEISEVNRAHAQRAQGSLAEIMREIAQLRLEQEKNAIEAAHARSESTRQQTEEHEGIMRTIAQLTTRIDGPRVRRSS